MPQDYKSTLNLPQTDFPMKAQLAKREPEMLKAWDEARIYDRMVERNADAKPFVFHDGPPYANGRIHHGHVLNKVLKDIVVKYQNMTGHCCSFVPGWDCHGLPIELAVERAMKESATSWQSEIQRTHEDGLALQRDWRIDVEKSLREMNEFEVAVANDED